MGWPSARGRGGPSIGREALQKLKLFSDRSVVPPDLPYKHMLYPFWGLSEIAETPGNRQRFERYREVGTSFFELTALEDSDVAVLPFDWQFATGSDATRDLALAFVTRAGEADKPVVIFYESDVLVEVRVENSLNLGASLYRSRRTPREFAFPGWTEDLLTKYRGATRRPPETAPADGGVLRLRPAARDAAGQGQDQGERALGSEPHGNHPVRAGGAGLLRPGPSPPATPAEPACRHQLRGAPRSLPRLPRGIGLAPLDLVSMGKQGSQLEFLQNLLESDYVLCARGLGNYSHRLYEALACGRIPLFIDTDCVLPFDFSIDWKRFGVWVDQVDLRSVADRVAEFHASISEEEFEELQVACRRLWEEWLSPEAFFANFHRHLDVMDLPGRNR